MGTFTTKVRKQCFSISTTSSFKSKENTDDAYRGNNSMKKLGELLRKTPMKIINFKNKKRSY